jgi:hypothetical protein
LGADIKQLEVLVNVNLVDFHLVVNVGEFEFLFVGQLSNWIVVVFIRFVESVSSEPGCDKLLGLSLEVIFDMLPVEVFAFSAFLSGEFFDDFFGKDDCGRFGNCFEEHGDSLLKGLGVGLIAVLEDTVFDVKSFLFFPESLVPNDHFFHLFINSLQLIGRLLILCSDNLKIDVVHVPDLIFFLLEALFFFDHRI